MRILYDQPSVPPDALRVEAGYIESRSDTEIVIEPSSGLTQVIYTWSDVTLETRMTPTVRGTSGFQSLVIWPGNILRFGLHYFLLEESHTLKLLPRDVGECRYYDLPKDYIRCDMGAATFLLPQDARVEQVEPGVYYADRPLQKLDPGVYTAGGYGTSQVLAMFPLEHMHRTNLHDHIGSEVIITEEHIRDEALLYAALHPIQEGPCLYNLYIGDRVITDTAAYIADAKSLVPLDRETALLIEQIHDADREFDALCKHRDYYRLPVDDPLLRIATMLCDEGITRHGISFFTGSPVEWIRTCDGNPMYRFRIDTTDLTVVVPNEKKVAFYPEAAPFKSGQRVSVYVLPLGTLIISGDTQPIMV